MKKKVLAVFMAVFVTVGTCLLYTSENSTTASIIAVAGAGKKKYWKTCKSLTTKNQFAILYLYKNGKQKL